MHPNSYNKNHQSEYDHIVIGAGMSGMAAAIRLAMDGGEVLLLDKHTVSGGLNSYYQRGHRLFDVGLHALTNYRGRPLIKVLRQLRLRLEDLRLQEQNFSQMKIGQHYLNFANDQGEKLRAEIQQLFGAEAKSRFDRLWQEVMNFTDSDLYSDYRSTRKELNERIKNPLLAEMILAPLLVYGSSWENDMDFSQFVIMFRALYGEGLARPEGGVRTIIELLERRLQEEKVEVRRGPSFTVAQIEGKTLVLKNGERWRARKSILSSIGLEETLELVGKNNDMIKGKRGRLSFTESIFILAEKIPATLPTIIFYNENEHYAYERSEQLFDERSAVICFPDSYQQQGKEKENGEGIVRVTFIANYEWWKKLDRVSYKEAKQQVAEKALALISKNLPAGISLPKVVFKDVFTPLTIERYTGHREGTVYGHQLKIKDGDLTSYSENLYLCGTDQGFLGIVGAMLSGVSIANVIMQRRL